MTQAVTNTLSAAECRQVRDFSGRIEPLGGRLWAFDPQGHEILAPEVACPERSAVLAEWARQAAQDGIDGLIAVGEEQEITGLCLQDDGFVKAVLLVDTARDADDSLRTYCDEQGLDYEQVRRASGIDRWSAAAVREMLESFAHQLRDQARSQRDLEKVSTELATTYEELMLVYNLSTHMRVNQSNANYLQLACDQITQLVQVEGIAVFLEQRVDGIEKLVLTAGSGRVTIDPMMADLLLHNLILEMGRGKEALLDSDVDSPFKYSWPESVRNIIAVPLQGKDKLLGLMVATNVVGKPDFDTIDLKLFSCVANQCTVFVENVRLFGDLKELFIGSLKALTNSIDAKDRYTRGHSERVAFISRWIAERLAEVKPIDEDQIHRIYLAGLLHDIGKIGISEAVLCKKGRLTDEELARIKAHPRLGASILSDIKQMRDIVPGVLHHHERIDGKGYPDGLEGERIPLIARIISLADSFDAMTSKRVYRDAMSIKRAVAEIEKGLGTQFDEEIGRVFISSDLRKLWNIIQDGFIESWDYSNFSEYGTIAVGTLIR